MDQLEKVTVGVPERTRSHNRASLELIRRRELCPQQPLEQYFEAIGLQRKQKLTSKPSSNPCLLSAIIMNSSPAQRKRKEEPTD